MSKIQKKIIIDLERHINELHFHKIKLKQIDEIEELLIKLKNTIKNEQNSITIIQ